MTENQNSEAISWEFFRKEFLQAVEPKQLIIHQLPRCAILTDPSSESFELHIASSTSESLPERTPRSIELRYLSIGGNRYLSVKLRDIEKAHAFLVLVFSVRDQFRDAKVSPVEAVERAVKEFRSFLQVEKVLSDAELLGLFGELWFLQKLIDTGGPAATGFWVDSTHDFRFSDVEVEVKTTASARPIHWVHGISQLEPSVGCSLYILSILAQSSNAAGATVPDLVSEIRSKLKSEPDQLDVVKDRLRSRRYRDEYASDYTTRFLLRSEPKLVLIDNRFPVINTKVLERSFDSDSLIRVGELNYQIDVSGLGNEFRGDESWIAQGLIKMGAKPDGR